jgi:hypothetical protein
VEIFYDALNVHRTYGTTFYMSCKGTESQIMPYITKGSIKCKAQFLYPTMKMRNYKRC